MLFRSFDALIDSLVLDIILRANKLGYMVDGTVVRIAPLSTLADEVCLLDRAVYEAWQAASWDSTKKRFANWHRPIRKAWKETITLAGLLRDLATFGQVRMTKGKQ